MKRISRFFLSFLFFLSFVVVSLSFIQIQTQESVNIGVLHREDFAYAPMMKNSFEMALEKINQEGGINGLPLKLIYGNDKGERYVGESMVKELADSKNTVMLLGGYSSSNTLYMARKADNLDLSFIVCTAADDRITKLGMENIYRLNPPASDYNSGLESFFEDRIKPTSLSIVYESSPFGTDLAGSMLWYCRKNDIEINSIIPYRKEKVDRDYCEKILDILKSKPPQIVYMVSYLKDAIQMVRTLHEMKLNVLICGGAGGFTHQKFISESGVAAENVLTASLWSPAANYPGTAEYYNQYIENFKEIPDYHGAEAYSALLVAADALRRSSDFSAEQIRIALDNTDILTPFGPVKFITYGNYERQNQLSTLVLGIQNGAFETIWPENLATSDFVPPSSWLLQ